MSVLVPAVLDDLRVSWATLTTEQVLEILPLRNSGLSAYEVAKQYKISPCAIRKIWDGQTWKHLQPGRKKKVKTGKRYVNNYPSLKGADSPRAKLTEAKVLTIWNLKSSGRTAVSVAKEFDTGPHNVSMIWRQVRWKHLTMQTI